jgi:hypothetical protein
MQQQQTLDNKLFQVDISTSLRPKKFHFTFRCHFTKTQENALFGLNYQIPTCGLPSIIHFNNNVKVNCKFKENVTKLLNISVYSINIW